jgi:Holliday junction DNA helicase RuvA
MIGKLKGIIDAVGEDEAVIDVNGVGYLVHAGTRTLSRLEAGAAAQFHIETYVREDQFKLFGFLDEKDRAWFVRLQSVQGVGAKHALAMLDAVTTSEIESAAALGDASTFERAKGVGKKLAQRIATELKDKAPPIGRGMVAGAAGLNAALGVSSSADLPSAEVDDAMSRAAAVSALTNLGYGEGDARRVVAQVLRDLGADLDEGALIKAALKELSS